MCKGSCEIGDKLIKHQEEIIIKIQCNDGNSLFSVAQNELPFEIK